MAAAATSNGIVGVCFRSRGTTGAITSMAAATAGAKIQPRRHLARALLVAFVAGNFPAVADGFFANASCFFRLTVLGTPRAPCSRATCFGERFGQPPFQLFCTRAVIAAREKPRFFLLAAETFAFVRATFAFLAMQTAILTVKSSVCL